MSEPGDGNASAAEAGTAHSAARSGDGNSVTEASSGTGGSSRTSPPGVGAALTGMDGRNNVRALPAGVGMSGSVAAAPPTSSPSSSSTDASRGTGGEPSDVPTPKAAPTPLDASETYQLDSDAYDSDSDAESLEADEYNALVDEANEGYTEEEVAQFVAQLKEDGLVNFLRTYLAEQPDGFRRSLRKLLLGLGIVPPRTLREPGTPDLHLLGFAKVALGRILRRRQKLSNVNTVDDAIELLRNAKRIIVLSGAGISTSCGIPDFRSATGLYAQLQAEGKYDLDDPQQMFDISYFREHPEVFYSFAKQIYPSNFVPSPCHRWIKLLEDRGQLLRNYTQNIDTLESLAGVDKVLQCHGSFKTASCLRCKTRMPGSKIEPYIMSQTIPWCPTCRVERDQEIEAIKAYRAAVRKGKSKKAAAWDDDDDDDDDIPEWAGEPGIIKPDITFFGQALDSEFDECLFRDREQVDLLVIMGTSLKVAPVSEVLSHIPHSVPQIFINLTPVTHVKPDISLLGDADSIVTYLSHRLEWPIPAAPGQAADDAIVRIPPSDAVWLHGDGDWGHLHMLRSRAALERAREAGVAEGGGDGEEGEADADETEDEGREAVTGRTAAERARDARDAEARATGTSSNSASASASGSRSRSSSGMPDSIASRATHLHIVSGTATPTRAEDRRSDSRASDRPAKRSRMGSTEELPAEREHADT